MCELLGISVGQAVLASEFLAGFARRGGEAADNPDGWGLAWWESGRLALRKAPEAAAWSAEFRALAQGLRSALVIGHVRKANPPSSHTLQNTHPFVRVCCGRRWVFAHNGKVPEVLATRGCCHPRHSRPAGETDSEHAFCYLLEEIHCVSATDRSCAAAFEQAERGRGERWFETLALRSAAIAAYGQFNFLMSDGVYLIAYGHDRLYRRAVRAAHGVWIASAPFTEDLDWEAFEPGELHIYRSGRRLARFLTGA
jgi:glutamine amidotransferase